MKTVLAEIRSIFGDDVTPLVPKLCLGTHFREAPLRTGLTKIVAFAKGD